MQTSSLQNFIVTNLSSGNSFMQQKVSMAMMISMASDEEGARTAIEQGGLKLVVNLPNDLSSDAARFLLAIAHFEENANLLVNAPGVLDLIARLIKNCDPTAVLIIKKITEYIGSPAIQAIRTSSDIIIGLCKIGTTYPLSDPICSDAFYAIADLSRRNVIAQDIAGAYLDAILKKLPADNRGCFIAAISAIVFNNFDNQMKFVEILVGNEDCLMRLLSKNDCVWCIKEAIRHPSKHSTQRTILCKIDAFRKIVIEQCNAGDAEFKSLLKILCSCHSGNYNRFVSDGYKFPDELNIKTSWKKRKIDGAAIQGATVPVSTIQGASTQGAQEPPNPDATEELQRLKCENEMLHAEMADIRRRYISAVCQIKV